MSDYSVLLLAYGQSNADVYPAEPALDCPAFEDPRIVTLADDYAYRGLMGKLRADFSPGFGQAARASYATKICRGYQSFQLPAAARLLHEYKDPALRHVVIRSEGRGGRRFNGIISKRGDHQEGILTNADGSDSQLLLNAIETIRICAETAQARGAPLKRVIINFLHGEANRSEDQRRYGYDFLRLIDRITPDIAELGADSDWLVLEPAGTSNKGSGNNWPCRMAMADVAALRPNVHLIGGSYSYPLDDVIHYSAEARVLFGEHFGAAAASLLTDDVHGDTGLGWLLDAPRLESAILSDCTVDLRLNTSSAFELHCGVSDPNLTSEGFSTTDTSACQIVKVTQTGPQNIRVTLDRAPRIRDRSALAYAYRVVQRQDRHGDSDMPAGRGGWRSAASMKSMFMPDQRIHQWVPGFIIPFGEMLPG